MVAKLNNIHPVLLYTCSREVEKLCLGRGDHGPVTCGQYAGGSKEMEIKSKSSLSSLTALPGSLRSHGHYGKIKIGFRLSSNFRFPEF